MRLGFNTLGRLSADTPTDDPRWVTERLDGIVEQGVLAERLGFDAFSIGEHHGDPTFVTSAPPVILAAIAARTQRIRLMTGVTLLPLLDPVRVAEDYATADHLSHGRIEIVAGKGNFAAASRLLIGEDEPDRQRLLEERLALLLPLLQGPVAAWDGGFRPPLRDAIAAPLPVQRPLPIWLGATRNVGALELAARHGLGAFIAGFRPGTYRDFAERYRDAFVAEGRDPADARIASLTVTSVEHDAAAARARFQRYWEGAMRQSGADSGIGRRPGMAFDDLVGPEGQVVVGRPEQLAERIIAEHEALGHDVHLIQVDGGRSQTEVLEAMQLIAEEVAPVVRRATGAPSVAA